MTGGNSFLQIFILCILCVSSKSIELSGKSVHVLEPGDRIVTDIHGLQIFCHDAKSKYLTQIWRTLNLNINTTLDNYELYEGATSQEVLEKHESNKRSWRLNLFGSKKYKDLEISPFENKCIGIDMYLHYKSNYTVTMTQINLDKRKMIGMILGLLIFWFGPRLSNNPIFYYLCGITFGVTMSILILLYLISKLFPKGKTMYLMVATGLPMSYYIAQILWENTHLILMQYREYVMWYIFGMSLISFLICYRLGPVTNVRTKRIIQWFLQTLGLLTIFYSSHYYEASFSCCILIVMLYNMPVKAFLLGKRYWKCVFPEKKKLLTEDEYRLETIRETNKALKDLQEYCSSPKCKQWKTVLKLKDPIRFAKFVEGDSHLSDEEVQEHDYEITRLIEECDYTDDEEDDY